MMLRLGLRLTLRSGREAAVRLLVTVAAVAIGVAILLAVFAEYHAFQATSRRPSWESTQEAPAGAPTDNETLWRYSENIYQGRFIEQLAVAPLGPHAPVIPGLGQLPPAGQYYASPALAALLRTVPRDQLRDRFPGSETGIIGDAGLSGPDALVIVIGYSPSQLGALPGTIAVDRVATAPQTQGTTNLYRYAFGIGAIALLFPLLILINTATRLAAARREERYAAMRLVGATPGQVSVIASVEAIIGAVLGTLLGIGVFLVVRPALGGLSLSGARFFPQTVTPGLVVYAGMVVGVPLAAAAAARVSLRRVRISPLGVSRKVTPRAPGLWRLVPLATGVPLFIWASLHVLHHLQTASAKPVFVGFVLIMLGLVLAGSWLTMEAARLLGKLGRGAASLLAARRLTDNPKGSFRTVSGLVLAVFVGTAIAVLVPALKTAQSPPSSASLTNVLRVPYNPGPKSGAQPQEAIPASSPPSRPFPASAWFRSTGTRPLTPQPTNPAPAAQAARGAAVSPTPIPLRSRPTAS